jgi:hypothetical protein
MQLVRPLVAANPRLFGRGPVRDLGARAVADASLSDDIKLFATTFLAGFLFVSILIG